MNALDRRSFVRQAVGLPLASCGLVSLLKAAPGSGSRWLDFELEASEGGIAVGGRRGQLFGFNGQIPGPAIEAWPGDHVRIRFRNSLRESTNLHYHGLHVPPTGNADNSFLDIPAGESLTYEFDIPTSHAGGTYWYHPHMHGSVARQVSRGLAGAFIVRGELDQIPEIAAASEVTLILQDFTLTSSGLPIEPSPMEQIIGREGDLVAVNGDVNPTLKIQTHGWLRLRIVNASSSRYHRLQLEEHPLFLVGTDGGALPAPEGREEILLTPGERVEVMVPGERPASNYRLLSLPHSRGAIGMGMTSDLPAASIVLATFAYEGQAERTWSLPQKLVDIEPLPAPSVRRSFLLGQGMGMGMGMMRTGGMNFTINGRRFDPNRVDTRVSLNTVEDWEFVNPMMMDHPMHIHTNPFQVIGRDGAPIRAWKDVVLVPANSRVRIRTAFRDFTGLAMYHCHILDHEDLGMMGTIQFSG